MHVLPVAILALLTLTLVACAGAAKPAGGDAPATPEDLLAWAHTSVKAQSSFRGAPTFYPADKKPSFTYSGRDNVLLADLGGDFVPHLLFLGDEAYSSDDGQHWRPMRRGDLAPMRIIYDPRMVLAYGREVVETPQETIEGRVHRVLEMQLDSERLLALIPQPPPVFRITSLTFPVPEKPNGFALQRLGWEVFLVRDAVTPETGDRFVEWEMLKDKYHVSFHETHYNPSAGRTRPFPPDTQLETTFFTATIQGVASLEPAVERELRGALQAYGADPELIRNARLSVEDDDVRQSFRPWVEQAQLRVWIEAETGLVGRMRWTLPGMGYKGEPLTFSLAFWDYGTAPPVRRPAEVMDPERAEVLAKIAEPNFDVLRTVLEAYKGAHGHYPDDLTPTLIAEELRQTGLTWPENPFRKAPARNLPNSPGDFSYALKGEAYHLSVYGWDHSMKSTIGPEPPVPTPVPR